MRLILNGIAVPLSNQRIGTTLQVDSLASLDTLQSSYTSTFELPLSNELRTALSNFQAGTSSRIEYTQIDAVLEYESLTFVGKAEIKEVTQSTCKIVLLNGMVNIFDLLEGLTLQDLDKADLRPSTVEARTVARVDTRLGFDYSSDYAYAVANFGDDPTTTLDIDYTYPFSFFYTVLVACFNKIGYALNTAEGIMIDPFFRKVAFAWNGSRYNEDAYFYVDQTGFETGTSTGVWYTVTGDELIGNSDFSSFTTYTVPSNMSRPFTLLFLANIQVFSGTSSWSYEARIYNETQGVAIASVSDSGTLTGGELDGSGGGSTAQTVNIAKTMYDGYAVGDEIKVQLKIVTGTRIDINSGAFRTDDGRDDYEAAVGAPKTNIYAIPPSADNKEEPLAFMPDLTIKKFIKAVAEMFMCRFEVDTQNKRVKAKLFKTYSQDTANSDTWTSKVNEAGSVRVKYGFGDYGKRNHLRYSIDENQESEIGSSFFDIDNAQLKNTADLVELPFAGSPRNRSLTNFREAVFIPAVTATGTPNTYTEEDLKPRCVYLEPAGTGTSIDVTDGTTTNTVSTPNKALFLPSLSFAGAGGLLTAYYSELTAMLENMQEVEIELLLNGKDWEELDFFTPKYLEFSNSTVAFAGYFLLQEVKEYDGRGPVTVRLINLNIT